MTLPVVPTALITTDNGQLSTNRRTIQVIMLTNSIPQPDLEFDPLTLDPVARRLDNLGDCPCPNRSGCYAWFDSESLEVLRVGRSALLRNRLQQYWNGREYHNAAFLDEERDMSVLWLRVWYTDAPYDLEQQLLKHYNPRFNTARS